MLGVVDDTVYHVTLVRVRVVRVMVRVVVRVRVMVRVRVRMMVRVRASSRTSR